jgi:hypothetical protein
VRKPSYLILALLPALTSCAMTPEERADFRAAYIQTMEGLERHNAIQAQMAASLRPPSPIIMPPMPQHCLSQTFGNGIWNTDCQ